jgi:hypothetical protein
VSSFTEPERNPWLASVRSEHAARRAELEAKVQRSVSDIRREAIERRDALERARAERAEQRAELEQ